MGCGVSSTSRTAAHNHEMPGDSDSVLLLLVRARLATGELYPGQTSFLIFLVLTEEWRNESTSYSNSGAPNSPK